MKYDLDPAPEDTIQTSLGGLRILDCTEPEGHLTGRILADLGAEVIMVEPSRGNSGRDIGPFTTPRSGENISLPFIHFNANKKSVLVDAAVESGKDILKTLIRKSDVILKSSGSGEFSAYELNHSYIEELNPNIIIASITGFGLSGPYKHFKAPSIVCSAMGGVMYLCGSPSKAPIAELNNHPYHLASAFAACGVLLALRNRGLTGISQAVDVSSHDVQCAQQHMLVNYSANSMILSRSGSRTPIGGGMPYGVYPTKDGYCYLVIISTAHWRSFVKWIGSPEALTDPIWDNRHIRIANSDLIEEITAEFTKTMSTSDLFHEGQARHITVAPINTLDEYIKDVHTRERGAFVRSFHPSIGDISMIRSPFRLSATPAQIFRPAPSLGQHNAEVEGMESRANPRISSKKVGAHKPLEGIRILDLTQAIAGPVLTQLLAQFGAEVIKVESGAHQQRGRSHQDLDTRVILQQKVTFADINRNKLSTTINLATDAGRKLLSSLIPLCDVVVENFSPRVMEGWGFGYEEIQNLRSDIIMLRLPGFGLDGPYRDYLGLAAVAMGVTGAYHLWSYPDELEPPGPPVWTPDYLSAAFASVTLMAALRYRDESANGQLIELSQSDAMAYILGPEYLEYAINGHGNEPRGNRHVQFSPHGVYRCKGTDTWCAIAVSSEDEWKGLLECMGNPHWSSDPRYSSLPNRVKNHQSLDRHIEEWTNLQLPHDIMKTLQNAGVPAGAVQNSKHIANDSHLRCRNMIAPMEYAETGLIDYPGEYVHLSKTPGSLGWCHRMGADNDYVFRTLLGLKSSEIKHLEETGIIA